MRVNDDVCCALRVRTQRRLTSQAGGLVLLLDEKCIDIQGLGSRGLSLFADMIDIACRCMMLSEKLWETAALRACAITPVEGPSTVALGLMVQLQMSKHPKLP